MPFTQSSESILTKIRSLRVPPAALIGAAVLAAVCIAAVAFGPLSGGTPTFVVPSDSAEESQGEPGDGPAGDAGTAAAASGAGGSSASAADGDATSSPAPFVTVHVAGAVADAGVYSIPEGSRVQDAVDAAGGLAKDAAPNAVNLARVLQDGEQVVIPTQEQVKGGALPASESAQASNGSGSSAAAAVVNINTAGADELDTLPGVGPATAQAIIEERESGGPFASVEDIQRVSGIGEKKFEKLKDSICV